MGAISDSIEGGVLLLLAKFFRLVLKNFEPVTKIKIPQKMGYENARNERPFDFDGFVSAF